MRIALAILALAGPIYAKADVVYNPCSEEVAATQKVGNKENLDTRRHHGANT